MYTVFKKLGNTGNDNNNIKIAIITIAIIYL